MKKRLAAGLILACLMGAARVHGATWRGRELEQKWREAAWRFGPFRIQPMLMLTNAGVDSNIFYSPGDPVKDYTLTAGPAATIYLPVNRKFILSAFGSPQYVYYVKTEQERTWNYYFNGAASLSLRRIFFQVEGRYSDAREKWNTEIDIRPRRKETGYGGSMLVQTSYRTSISVGYRELRYDYENLMFDVFNVRERLNRKERYGNLSGYYRVSSRTMLFLDFEYGDYVFDFASTAAISDSRSQAAYGGLEFSPRGKIRGKVRLGYKRFDIKDPAGQDYEGIVGDTLVSVRVAKPLVLRGSYKRDVSFSLWYNNPYYLENRPGVGASIYLLRFLRLDYDYSLGRNKYPVVGGGGPDVKRLDDFTIHSAGVYFRIKKNVALGVIASRWKRDSNLDAEDDTRSFLGLNLTYDF